MKIAGISFMKNMEARKRLIILILILMQPVMFIFGGIVVDFYRDWKEDNRPQHVVVPKFGLFSNFDVAEYVIDNIPQYLNLIASCERFPENFSYFFRKREDDCGINVGDIIINNGPYWIDPWGRLYQIRYDLDGGKLQVRSRGRYEWTSWDDIIKELPFLDKNYPKHGKALYVNMLEYYEKAQREDMNCIFNLGWH